MILENDSSAASSSKVYLDFIREINDRVNNLEVYLDKYYDGKILSISGSRRLKYEGLKYIFQRMDSRRRSPDRRSPRRDSPRRDSPKRNKQSSINITVPESFVARLIGKNGENIKNIMHKSNTNISFQKQEQAEIKTPDGGAARICTLKGSPTNIADGLKILLDQIISLSRH